MGKQEAGTVNLLESTQMTPQAIFNFLAESSKN